MRIRVSIAAALLALGSFFRMATAAQDQHTVPPALGGDHEQTFTSGMSGMAPSYLMKEINRVVAPLEHETMRLRVEVTALGARAEEIGEIRLEIEGLRDPKRYSEPSGIPMSVGVVGGVCICW